MNLFHNKVFGFSLTAILLSVIFSFYNDPFEQILAGFKRNLEEQPQEKVYVHTDRAEYASGETIWYKAYLTYGPAHVPSGLSSTVYIELINSSDSLISINKGFVVEGSSIGQFEIPEDLASGEYIIRAYTNWMRNNEEEFFFHKQIRIVSGAPSKEDNRADSYISFNLFPEGGDLVTGIQSRVAFKAIGTDGLSRKVTGKVVSGNEVVTEFSSNSLGMGVFYLKPEEGKEYVAVIEGGKQEIDLPKAKKSGLTMSVLNQPAAKNITIRIETDDFSKIGGLGVIAQARGIVCYSAKASMKANFLMLRIPKESFPSGVSQITLVNEAGSPLAERLVFVDHNDGLVIKVNPDKKHYAPREKVVLNIEAKDENGDPIAGDFSVAVVDSLSTPSDKNRENIKSYLLMTSELRGNIESPGYYFNDKNEDRHEALDCLLLTQGWRRFTIKQALENKPVDFKYKVEKGVALKGRLVNVNNDKPLQDGLVTMTIFGDILDEVKVGTDAEGKFKIDSLVFFDGQRILLKGENKNKRGIGKVILDVEKEFPSLKYKTTRNVVREKELSEDWGLAADWNLRLNEVKIKGKSVKEEKEKGRIYKNSTFSVDFDDDSQTAGNFHPFDLIKGKWPAVRVIGTGQSAQVEIRATRESIVAQTKATFLLDEMPVDAETLAGVPVHQIESIKAWIGPDAAIFGIRGGAGVIAFYTKKGGGSASSMDDSGMAAIAGIGYKIGREFYSPEYDVESPSTQDKRKTLFWAPLVRTDANGKAQLSFYNHDSETSVSGIIEGLSLEGQLGVGYFGYQIKKK